MKILDCPKCGGKPEKFIRYEAVNSIIVHCPGCGLSTKRWKYADIEWCAADEALKDWNKLVKAELKRRKNNEDPQS